MKNYYIKNNKKESRIMNKKISLLPWPVVIDIFQSKVLYDIRFHRAEMYHNKNMRQFKALFTSNDIGRLIFFNMSKQFLAPGGFSAECGKVRVM